LIEAQAPLSHSGYLSSTFILARQPSPRPVCCNMRRKRRYRCEFSAGGEPTPRSEITLIEPSPPPRVIGMPLTMKGYGRFAEIPAAIAFTSPELQKHSQSPRPLACPPERLVPDG